MNHRPRRRQCFMAALALALAAVALAPARAQFSVEWLTQYGSTGTERAWAIAVDEAGRSWVSGHTGANFGGPSGGGVDTFLSRVSAGGEVDFVQQRGGTGGDFAYGVAVIGSGTAVAGGYTSFGAIDGQSPLGVYDALLVRYDASGVWQGTTLFGGSGLEEIYGMAGNGTHLLAAGRATGFFEGQTAINSSWEALLTKRDANGAVVWTRFIGTIYEDIGRSVAFDSAGNAYIAGKVGGNLSGSGSVNGDDLFVARYDEAGNQTLLLQLGSSGYEYVADMEVDVQGNIYLTGATNGGLGGFTNQGGDDGFVMKLDRDGNVLWTRQFGGTAFERGRALGLDDAGRVWIGGSIESSYSLGAADAFVALYDTDGLLLDTLSFASLGDEYITGLDVGPDGVAYVTGYTSGRLGTASAGDNDVFVAKIVPEPSTALLLGGAGLGLLLRRRR